MAQVYLPRSLLVLFPTADRRAEVEAATVDALIARLDERWPGMRARLCDAGPVIREHINVFVDGERGTLQTPLRPGSVVHVIPAVSGGCPPGAIADRAAARHGRMRLVPPRVPGRPASPEGNP